MSPGRLLWGLIITTGLVRLLWGTILGLGMDEAYHSLFVARLDWSYFDHPPMLALVEWIGVNLAGGTMVPITLRVGFIVLFAGSTWLMARLTTRFFGPWAGLLAAFALNVSAYQTAAAGVFVLPDGPLLFFWLLTIDRVAEALEHPERWLNWVWVGVAWGGGMLSKYHAIFLPAGVFLFALAEPSARHLLRRVGPYLAAGIGVVMFAPVLYWNGTHAWVSFVFQGGRAVGSWRFQPVALLSAIGGQAAYLFPWIWLTLVVILVGRLRAMIRGHASVAERFLVCQSVIPLTVFTAVACFRPVLPHWTLVGFLTIFPMVGQLWESRWRANPGRTGRRFAILAAVPLLAMTSVAIQYETGFMNRLGLSAKLDPTADLYGWDQIAREIDRRGLLNQPNTFLFTSSWFLSGQMGFATRRFGEPVFCYNHKDPHNFAFWSRPDDSVGHDGLLVSIDETKHEPAVFARYFERIEPPIRFDVTRHGRVIRQVRLFRCVRQVTPFRFAIAPE